MQPIPAGFHPFWFWNGPLDEREVRWQIGEMAAQGIRGFYIHPRQGLETPYLSRDFLDLVAVAVDEAARLGMTAHLYDEYPYPSGAAGGQVTLGEPRFEGTTLTHVAFDAGDVAGREVALRRELPRGAVLCCLAAPIVGGVPDWGRAIDLRDRIGTVLATRSYRDIPPGPYTPYNRKRFFASDPVPVLQTALKGAHRVHVALQERISSHKYWGTFPDMLDPEAVQRFLALTHERYATHLGKRLAGIASVFVDETEPHWSPRLLTAWRDRFGEDMAPLLPALTEATHPRHDDVRSRLHRLRLELFEASFERPYAAWCAAHGMRYAGEKPSLRLSQLRSMDIPGCEPGHFKAGAPRHDLLKPTIRGNARATASAAWLYGKEGALCECYHSIGWSATLQDAKLIAEALLVMGIRFLVPHGLFATTHALAKHDAPPTFFFQQPYWPLFGRLSARVARICERLDGSWIDARIALVDPTPGLPNGDDREAHERLHHALCAAHLDYVVLDRDALEAAPIVGAPGAACAVVRELSLRVVIVPPMRVPESELDAWLARFSAAGGIVIRAGGDVDVAVAAARAAAPPALTIVAREGDARRVLAVTRRSPAGRQWLLLNLAREPVTLSLDAGSPLREIALDELPPRLDGMVRRLDAFESVLLAEETSSPTAVPAIARVRVGGPCAVRARSPNLLRLGRWLMALPEQGPEEAEVEPMPLANQLDTARARFAPRIAQGFGTAAELRLPALRVRYRCAFDVAYDGAVQLVMEPGAIAGDWTIRINGSEPLRAVDFAPVDAHVRGSLGVDISRRLRPGANTIEVEVDARRLDDGLLDPLLLAGDFAAIVSPPTIGARPERGAIEDYAGNGLPYFAGVVEYELPLVVEAGSPAAPDLLELVFDRACDEACEVSLGGGPWRAVPWSPRLIPLAPGELAADGRLRVRVHTSLIRAFEGQWFDAVGHRYRDVGDTG